MRTDGIERVNPVQMASRRLSEEFRIQDVVPNLGFGVVRAPPGMVHARGPARNGPEPRLTIGKGR